jgi:hypothetical protein
VTAGLSQLLRALQTHKLRKTGSGWAACCPAHEDKRPSLSITEAAKGLDFGRVIGGMLRGRRPIKHYGDEMPTR